VKIKFTWPLIFLLLSSCTVRYSLRIDGVIYNLRKRNYSLAEKAVKKSLKKGSLLYYLELGTIQHYAKDFKRSNHNFEDAENLIEELYTRSISKQTAALFTSENIKPYRPEDYENVLINYYRAFNYFYLNDLEDATVEARKVDEKLERLNDKYKKKNAYRDDAFMEFISGVFHEMSGEYNDALISYKKSYETFKRDYAKYYGICVPEFILESIKRMSIVTGIELFDESIDSIKANPDDGVLLIILEYGLIPQKRETFTDLWVKTRKGRTKLIRVAFPYLPDTTISLPSIKAKLGNLALPIHEVEPIYKIAERNLKDKMDRIVAKAMLRAAVKYGTEAKIESELRKKYENLSDIAGFFINIFNVFTERADTREWATLPATILVGYQEVPPGNYPVSVFCEGDTLILDTLKINKGEIKLIKIRKF